MKVKRSTWHIGVAVLASLALTLVLAACGGGGTTPSTEPTEEIIIQEESRVRREFDVVWAGPGDVNILPQLDDGWYDFPTGSRITTDPDGEGLVEIEECLRIYVFQQSGLVKATCPQSDYAAGNVMCMEEGGASFNNECSGQLIIQTRSADILLEGTWVSIFYLPENRLTLVLVFDHTAAVDTVRMRPVLDFEERRLGDFDVVREGFFWFTTPEGGPEEVADLAARQPHPFDRLPELIEALDLWPWIERVQRRADRDDVPFPDFEEVAVDDVPPTIFPVRVTPANPSAGDAVTIAVETVDVESGTDRIAIFFDGQLVGRCADFACSATVEDVPGGVFTYRVEAYDRAGNQAAAEGRVSIARGLPDLVVTEFEVVGRFTFTEGQELQIPVQVTVRNQGAAVADRFGVAINYAGSAGDFQVRFIARGQENTWVPLTDGPLRSGQSVTLQGVVQLRSDLAETDANLFAEADSCAGEEFMPRYCRVEESDESNNVGGPLTDSAGAARGGSIVLTGLGGPLDDVRVQEALLAAAPWAELASILRDDVAPQQLSLAFPDIEADADQVEYDPELAYQLLAEAGYPDGFGIVLLVPQDDGTLEGASGWITEYLTEFGLETKMVFGSPAELDEMLKLMVDSGEAAMLLQRQ